MERAIVDLGVEWVTTAPDLRCKFAGMLPPIRDYRDLIAWQRAMDLAVVVDVVVDRLPRRSWKLAAQMRDAARSVHSNIAEGNGRLTIPDYLRHLSMSNASLSELESDLFFMNRRHPHPDVSRSLELVLETRRPLAGLITALRKKKKDEQ
jgi:four helix bundle protein